MLRAGFIHVCFWGEIAARPPTNIFVYFPVLSLFQVFCPRCGDLYFPSGYVRACDGAFWGTTLPHLLLLGWPELKTSPNPSEYVPRVFGFKVHTGELGAGVEGTLKGAAGQVDPQEGLL